MITNDTKLLIFDFDGLLVDTEKIYKEGWLYALRNHSIDISENTVNSWAGKSFHDTTSYVMSVCREAALCKRIREERERYIYISLKEGKISAKPYALDALKCAKENGYTTGLATSSARNRSIAILEHLGLLPYLDIQVFADDVQRLKPHPDLYQEVLKRAGCSSSAAQAFEDSITGFEAAKAAGIEVTLIPDDSFDDDCLLEYKKENDLSIVRTWIEKVKSR